MKEFRSFESFSLHLVALVAIQPRVDNIALEKAAIVIETETKRRFGEYQDVAGPFGAWAELADFTKEDRVRKGYPEDEPLLRTGGLRDSYGHRVGDGVAYIGSDSPIAVAQELGTDRMPPRSTIGGAAVAKADLVAALIGEEVAISLAGEGVFARRVVITAAGDD